MTSRVTRAASALAGLSLLAGGLVLAAAGPAPAVPGALTFAGTGFGAIPDGGTTNSCPNPGAPRDVTFAVTGMPSFHPADVRVTGLAITHAYVGDLVVTLIAPNGSSRVLFGRTGAISQADFGDESDVAGPYTFADDAAGNVGDPSAWWAAADVAGTTAAIPAGSYRTSTIGGTPASGAVTGLTSAFNTVTSPNGTWTLRFTDSCESDLGTVTAATLELVPGAAPNCTAQQAAVTSAQARVASTNAAKTAAAADAAKADQAVQAATAAVANAEKSVAKAEKALKKAKQSGDPNKIKKAKQKLKAAKADLKAAQAALATARQNAAAAHQKQTSAEAAATAAQAELTAAQAALAACQASRAA